MTKRKQKSSSSGQALFEGTGYYTQQIIKRLEMVYSATGQRPYTIFDDWTRIVEATLEALPEQVKTLGLTGALGQDTPETAEVFRQVRERYENIGYPSAHRKAWQGFGEAFTLLLESSAPSLWGQGVDFNMGYMGPDVIGHVYMTYSSYDKSWLGQYFTPWGPALLMAKMTILDGQREVYDRIKAALLHPDNILGHSVLLASLVIEDKDQAWNWFLTRVIPAALPYYEPILFQEPAIGSGVMMLAAASCYPAWAVQMNLIRFFGQDLDPICIRMAKINGMLYGLNGYAMKLAEAVGVAVEARQQREEQTQLVVPNSISEALKTIPVYSPANPPEVVSELTFESLFRTAVVSQMVEMEAIT